MEALWDFICSVVSAIADAVMKAVSFIVEWILGTIKAMIDVALAPLREAYDSWVSSVAMTMGRIITIGDTDDIDVGLLLATMFSGAFIELMIAVAYLLICVIEPLLLVFLNLIPGLDQVTSVLTQILMQGAQYLGKLALAVAISTALVMFGEVLAALIPHDDPALAVITATGVLAITIVATALQKFITKKSLGKDDVTGLVLALIGFGLSLGGEVFMQYGHLVSVIGTGIAGVGLAISLSSPDMPSIVGFLDEGINSALTGWAAYDAVNR